MAKSEHLELIKRGVKVWNKWRNENPHIRPDLYKSDLSYMDLEGVNLSNSDLNKAILRGAKLCKANFESAHLAYAILNRAILDGANMCHAELYGTKLIGANLKNAKLCFANLVEVDLQGGDLSGTDFSEVTFGRNIFSEIDLSDVKGIDTAHHIGPSLVGIEVIYKSKGIVPESFLRGTGVPGNFIEYVKSLDGRAKEYHSCFISYSHKDENFTKHLHSRMRNDGFRVWFAPKDIKGGEKIHEQIDEAIRFYDKLLIVVSENSMSSEWVATEIYKARQREIKENKRILFPISLVEFEKIQGWELFDADSGKDMAREIREYHIPDFQDWKNQDSFEESYTKLREDLKANK